jgi:hypothetical protein
VDQGESFGFHERFWFMQRRPMQNNLRRRLGRL